MVIFTEWDQEKRRVEDCGWETEQRELLCSQHTFNTLNTNEIPCLGRLAGRRSEAKWNLKNLCYKVWARLGDSIYTQFIAQL